MISQQPDTVPNTGKNAQGSRLSLLPMAREWRWVRVAHACPEQIPNPPPQPAAAAAMGPESEVGERAIEPGTLVRREVGQKGEETTQNSLELCRVARSTGGLGRKPWKTLEPPSPPTAFHNLRWPLSRWFYLITTPYTLSKKSQTQLKLPQALQIVPDLPALLPSSWPLPALYPKPPLFLPT